LQALDTWNAAQEWFHSAYDPKGNFYRFQVDQNGLVTIGFGTVYEYVNNSPTPLPCSDCSGIANSEYERGIMKRVQITVSTSSSLGGRAFSEAGMIQVSLVVGLHNITLPAVVKVNERTRLLFASWLGEGKIGPSLAYELVLNANLTAIYTTQYSLVIRGYDNRTLNTYWYNSGARAAFVPPTDVIQSVSMEGPFGELGAVWRLSGWSDNGQPISPNTSFVMTQPHTIVPRYSADYTTPIVLISILGALCVTVVIAYLRKRAGNS
jgi:hypothetical protein